MNSQAVDVPELEELSAAWPKCDSYGAQEEWDEWDTEQMDWDSDASDAPLQSSKEHFVAFWPLLRPSYEVNDASRRAAHLAIRRRCLFLPIFEVDPSTDASLSSEAEG